MIAQPDFGGRRVAEVEGSIDRDRSLLVPTRRVTAASGDPQSLDAAQASAGIPGAVES